MKLPFHLFPEFRTSCSFFSHASLFTSDSDKVKTTQAVKESKTAKAAKTGDNSPIMAYVFGAMAGALILGVSFLKKRKNTNN